MTLTNNPKWREFTGKVYYMPNYLKELSILLQRNVVAEDLLSLSETDSFFEQSRNKSEEIVYKSTLDFTNKQFLLDCVHENVENWDTPYMIYLCDVDHCGLLEIDTLSDFNWNFKFTDEHCGFIGFIRKDMNERIVLDYYEENTKLLIDIEIYRGRTLRSPLKVKTLML